MSKFVRRLSQRFVHYFVPKTFVVLLSPNHENVPSLLDEEKKKEIVAHFSQYARVLSYSMKPHSVTLLVVATHAGLRLTLENKKLESELHAGYEEIKRKNRHEETYILAHETD